MSVLERTAERCEMASRRTFVLKPAQRVRLRMVLQLALSIGAIYLITCVMLMLTGTL